MWRLRSDMWFIPFTVFLFGVNIVRTINWRNNVNAVEQLQPHVRKFNPVGFKIILKNIDVNADIVLYARAENVFNLTNYANSHVYFGNFTRVSQEYVEYVHEYGTFGDFDRLHVILLVYVREWFGDPKRYIVRMTFRV